MQLHQVAYVLAVAEEESFTRAADRLRLAQPSLSRQIRLLEKELGVVLFNRGPGQGRVTLTPDGSALLPFLQRVLSDVEATGAEARALSGMVRGHLAVGATPSLTTSLLAPALVEFHAMYPGIDLSVTEAGSHQLVPQVAAGEVDLALVVLPVADPLVLTTSLFDDPLVLAIARDHPFAGRSWVRVLDLDGLDLVMFREGYDLRAVTLAACAEAGVEPHLVCEGGEMAGVLSFVAAGLGAAVVPAIALPDEGALLGIPFSGPTLSRTVVLAQRGDRALARPARALADQLLADAGDMAGTAGAGDKAGTAGAGDMAGTAGAGDKAGTAGTARTRETIRVTGRTPHTNSGSTRVAASATRDAAPSREQRV